MGESVKWDAREDVAPAEWVVVETAAPFDLGMEWDFDAFGSHRLATGGIDFCIEGVEHVDSEVEPVSSEVMACGEAAHG